MLKTLKNAWGIEELRKKILFTLFIILVYRLGNAVPVPYVNTAMLESYFNTVNNTILGLWNTMSGGSFSMATIFALSIQPYINASIIIQLLTIAIPALERLQKEGGEEGRKKLASITRYTTVGIGLIMGFAYYMLIKNGVNGQSMLTADGAGVWPAIVIIMTFMAGSALIMWMGEQVTEFGVGNGISIILFASIIARFPSSIGTMITNVSNGSLAWWALALVIVGALAIVVLIVIVNDAERRIPVQYSKRVVGRKLYGGQSTHLPMKVNMSGVMPIIFAQSIASIPATICAFVPSWQNSWLMVNVFNTNTVPYAIIYFLLIIVVQLLLRHHPVRPRRDRQQPEEERRLHPRLPRRQADQRVYQEGAQQDHPHGRSVPEHRGRSAHPDRLLHHGDQPFRHIPRRHLHNHSCGRCN